MKSASPLRYPGGKWRITQFFESVIALNELEGTEYVEPYAGGASLALSLLLAGRVSTIHLNDLDPAIYSFWHSVLHRTKALLRLIAETPLTVAEWRRQKETYSSGADADTLALGFATFYLNRTNHSGVMSGGIIGGTSQDGEWRIDARFNRRDLQERIERVASFKSSIHIYNEDAVEFTRARPYSPNALIYMDPPYYRPGKRALYLNTYDSLAHAKVCGSVKRLKGPWIVSYDDVPEVRALYSGVKSRRIGLLHNARSPRLANEVMFFAPSLRVPRLYKS